MQVHPSGKAQGLPGIAAQIRLNPHLQKLNPQPAHETKHESLPESCRKSPSVAWSHLGVAAPPPGCQLTLSNGRQRRYDLSSPIRWLGTARVDGRLHSHPTPFESMPSTRQY